MKLNKIKYIIENIYILNILKTKNLQIKDHQNNHKE